MSISISSNQLLANDIYKSLAEASNETASTTATSAIPVSQTPTVSATAAEPSANSSTNPLLEDMTSLLQALASGNVSGAQADLTKIKADLAEEVGADAPPSATGVGKGHGHHHHEAAASVTDSSTSSSAESTSASSTSSSQPSSPLATLLSQISSSLNSGDTGGALTDLASFLVQNGQGNGNLINTTA